jgi:hypothetical protein
VYKSKDSLSQVHRLLNSQILQQEELPFEEEGIIEVIIKYTYAI